ncbi:Retrovirus-related Pol polyprotein from transposon 17.6 [Cucumis melo var. makuwa]|uniref:Retrovirus-related Pol polyprotein from transposon 17.6 n=2 Tax=Cucumis melo TaxID=3656 RepID=A0A5D3BS70_CUCMM|nr:Retrovirus-related Pol polyprotein from transposon 17.6 [Cucumis melo var. makuwa]
MVREGIMLRHKISSARIEVDPTKIDVASKLPLPSDVFQTLKDALTSVSILITPDWSQPFELICDRVMAMLGPKKDKVIYLIYYASKTLNEAQKNYTTTKKELLAVVFAIDKFRSYIIAPNTPKALYPSNYSGEVVSQIPLYPHEIPTDRNGRESQLVEKFPPLPSLKRKGSTSRIEVDATKKSLPDSDPLQPKTPPPPTNSSSPSTKFPLPKSKLLTALPRDENYVVGHASSNLPIINLDLERPRPMNEGFQEGLRENVALKDQVANLNTTLKGLNAKLEGLEATVSQLNFTVSQFSATLQNFTGLMIAYYNQSYRVYLNL